MKNTINGILDKDNVIQAVQQVEVFLSKKEIWENLQVVAFELNDARDDLNDALKRAEEALKFIPPFESGSIFWNGQNLLYDGKSVLYCSIQIRQQVGNFLSTLL